MRHELAVVEKIRRAFTSGRMSTTASGLKGCF
jgi:hypothetical protein